MYKPQTDEQYKIRQILEKRLVIDDLYIIPLSRTALMVEDKYGIRLTFSYQNGVIKEAEIPQYPSDDQAKKYLRYLKATDQLPNEFIFEDTTRWWMDNPSPLSHRQILGLGTHMYHHYLKNRILYSFFIKRPRFMKKTPPDGVADSVIFKNENYRIPSHRVLDAPSVL